MKRNIWICLVASALFALTGLVCCGHHHEDHDGHDHDHAATETHAAEAGETEEAGEHHHGDEIILEPEVAERFGVETRVIEPGNFHEVLKVTGRIIDTPQSASVVSAPTSGIVHFAGGIQEGASVGSGATIATVRGDGVSGGDSNKTQRAAIDAAKRELDRIKPLYEEGIVSAKDYNAALEAYEVASTQYSGAAASGAARSVAAGVITQLLVRNGQYVEAGEPLATLSANSRLTLRADVPDRHSAQLPLITSARIALPHSGEMLDLSEMGGRRVSAATTARTSPGYVPLFFSFDSHGKLLPQTVAEVYLIGAQRAGVLSVPTDAVVEQQGLKFIFVKVDDEGYEKRQVKTGASDGERIEITEGLKPGENVVVKGAMTVRLAETSGAVPEGHSHSH